MADNLARKLIASHLVDGRMQPGEEIALRRARARQPLGGGGLTRRD